MESECTIAQIVSPSPAPSSSYSLLSLPKYEYEDNSVRTKTTTTTTSGLPHNCDSHVVLPENFDVFSNILSLLSDDAELQPINPMSSNIMLPVQTGEPSSFGRKKTTVFDEASDDYPRIQEGTSGDQGTGSRRRQLRRRIYPKLHASCERKRRDRLREKFRTLRELLPNTSSKMDQATLLDVAALYIKSLQSQLQLSLISMGRMHLCRGGYQSTPRASIPGFGGQGIGLDPGMGFHVPSIPCHFHQMAAPVEACVFPSVLIPRLDSTFISNPVPGESTVGQTAPIASFLNPHPGITQQGVWEPSTNEMLLRPTLGYSVIGTGVGPGLGEQGTTCIDAVYRFPACLSNLSTMPLSETNLPPRW